MTGYSDILRARFLQSHPVILQSLRHGKHILAIIMHFIYTVKYTMLKIEEKYTGCVYIHKHSVFPDLHIYD